MWAYSSVYNFLLLLFFNYFSLTKPGIFEFSGADQSRCQKTTGIDEAKINWIMFDRPLYLGWDVLKANSTDGYIFDYTMNDCKHTTEPKKKQVFFTGDQTKVREDPPQPSSAVNGKTKNSIFLDSIWSYVSIIGDSFLAGALSQRFQDIAKFLSGTFDGKKIYELDNPEVTYTYDREVVLSASIPIPIVVSSGYKYHQDFVDAIKYIASIMSDKVEESEKVQTEMKGLIKKYGTHYFTYGTFGTHSTVNMAVNGGGKEIGSAEIKYAAQFDSLIIVNGELWPISTLMSRHYPGEKYSVMTRMAEQMQKAVSAYLEENKRVGCTRFEEKKFDPSKNSYDEAACSDEGENGGNSVNGSFLYVLLQSFVLLFFFLYCF